MPLHALLLEDDPGIQSFVSLALEDMPVVLHCCASLQAARALLREHELSLILADMHLPDGNGLELLTQLCQHNQPPYCIVFSGDIAPALERQLLQQGGVEAGCRVLRIRDLGAQGAVVFSPWIHAFEHMMHSALALALPLAAGV